MSDWRAELRSRGYRLTPQREIVLAAVHELGHATPEDVLGHARRTSEALNISTVYRTLELLEQLGLVSHAHLDHGAPTYHSTEVPAHLHLVCEECGRVTDAEPGTADSLVEALVDAHGFIVDVSHLSVSGRCRDCVAAGVR